MGVYRFFPALNDFLLSVMVVLVVLLAIVGGHFIEDFAHEVQSLFIDLEKLLDLFFAVLFLFLVDPSALFVELFELGFVSLAVWDLAAEEKVYVVEDDLLDGSVGLLVDFLHF